MIKSHCAVPAALDEPPAEIFMKVTSPSARSKLILSLSTVCIASVRRACPDADQINLFVVVQRRTGLQRREFTGDSGWRCSKADQRRLRHRFEHIDTTLLARW